MTTLTHNLLRLAPDDLPEILELERRCFPPPLRADAATLEARFERGHTMLGVKDDDGLVAMLAQYLAPFDPRSKSSFPSSLRELCLQPAVRPFDAAYLYNLEIDPRARGLSCAKRLVRMALDEAAERGCRYGVANCRTPSYGSEGPRFRPEYRRAVDRYLRDGRYPSQEEFLGDPTLALYHRLTGCRFHWILPDFAPEDAATGGVRVIACGELDQRPWLRLDQEAGHASARDSQPG